MATLLWQSVDTQRGDAAFINARTDANASRRWIEAGGEPSCGPP